MVVIQDDADGCVCDRGLHHFTWMNRGAVHRAAEQVLRREQPVPSVQMQHPEDLVVQGTEVKVQELVGALGRAQHRRTGAKSLREQCVGSSEYILWLRLTVAGGLSYVERGHGGGLDESGRIARSARATPQRSRQWAQPAHRAASASSRAAIDGENGVVRSSDSAIRPTLSESLVIFYRVGSCSASLPLRTRARNLGDTSRSPASMDRARASRVIAMKR